MACCDFFEDNQRNDVRGEGERDYREHVSSRKLSFGEIVVVVVAAVMLAGMGLAHQNGSARELTTASIRTQQSEPLHAPLRCDDDNRYLSDRCNR